MLEEEQRITEWFHKYSNDILGIKGLTNKETADILYWSENKVSVTFNRALKALGKKIGELDDEK